MAHDAAGIVDRRHSHAGETLQAVIVYDGESHRDLYRREDVGDLHGSELETEVLEEIRAGRQRRESTLADRYEGATVRVFEARVSFHFPRDDGSGTVVVLDPAAARNLVTFVDDVRGDIYGIDDRRWRATFLVGPVEALLASHDPR
ncbi:MULTISPECIES: hypothetical protein [Halolamina]|uniref:Uncharacterized protein n=1 Tax=Halolamina pelagica TaxID=699431 RepID=A0A1I5MDP4_9EURY|nr:MULTISPECIES: hypothetical protein [Halolamina]SFP07738.1 hypothetical protein SAMN05216277_101225 [Halolamina pelagica]